MASSVAVGVRAIPFGRALRLDLIAAHRATPVDAVEATVVADALDLLGTGVCPRGGGAGVGAVAGGEAVGVVELGVALAEDLRHPAPAQRHDGFLAKLTLKSPQHRLPQSRGKLTTPAVPAVFASLVAFAGAVTTWPRMTRSSDLAMGFLLIP